VAASRPPTPQDRPVLLRARRAALLLLAGGTVLAACGGSARRAGQPVSGPTTPTTAQAVTARSPLRWTACRVGEGPVGFQCATLQVPLDWSDPARGTIGLALDRKPASGRALGTLVTDPGGPGVSGVDFLPGFVSELPAVITRHFDVVAFDPPGVGRSDPVICGDSAQLTAELTVDPAPTSTAGFDALVGADRRFAAGCERDSARILPYVSTVDAARDLEALRAALGPAGLTYLGFSYGTFLGATFAELYPHHVRAMVLDGALDPALGSVATVDQQSAALEGELDAFLSSCAHGGCGWDPGGNLLTDLEQLVDRVRADPVTVAGSGQSVGPAVLLYGAAAALYDPADWPLLGQALTALDHGDGGPILDLFDAYVGRSPDGSYANTVEAETAVDCLDQPVPSLSALRADEPAAARAAPVFGALDLYSEATCSVWPLPPTGRPAPIHAPGAPPIVVVGTTHDPITPYAWAEALASQLDRGVLLTREGYGHTAYGYSSCIRTVVDRYLLTTTPPKPGTVCPST
jgi:pimeloyl-ACP methyl ester carboxylesterase